MPRSLAFSCRQQKCTGILVCLQYSLQNGMSQICSSNICTRDYITHFHENCIWLICSFHLFFNIATLQLRQMHPNPYICLGEFFTKIKSLPIHLQCLWSFSNILWIYEVIISCSKTLFNNFAGQKVFINFLFY